MTKRVGTLLVLAGLAALSCRVENEKIIPEDPPVIIHRGHQHSKYCGHYFHDGVWYFAYDHRHGAGCGHVLVEGVWRLKV
jgi:hypothetical protein